MRTLCRSLFLVSVVLAVPTTGDGGSPKDGSVAFDFIGPGSGGSMFGIAVDPKDPDIILFGGDMGAAYRTENGGRSWDVIGGASGCQPGRGGVWQIKAAPGRTGTYWCVGAGAFRSTDGGKTWQCMTGSIGSVTIGAVEIDPHDANRVFIAEGYPPRGILSWVNGNVWQTADGGARWKKLPRPGGSLAGKDGDGYRNRTFSNLLVDPSRPYVYLSGRGGLFRWDGSSWKEIGLSLPGYHARQAADICLVGRKGKQLLFATLSPMKDGSAGGVYLSEDGGESWTARNRGLETLIERTRQSNSLDKPHVFPFILAHSPDKPERLYLGTHYGLARSDDLGKQWNMLTPVGDDDTHTDYFYRLATDPRDFVGVVTGVSKFTKSLWGGIDQMNRMIASPSNGDIVLFSDNQDLYRSTDGGEHWESITFDYTEQFVDFDMYSNRSHTLITAGNRYEYEVRSRGVQNIVADAIAVDPTAPDTLYAAYRDLGLEVSRDGGQTWEHPVTTSTAHKISRDDFLPPRGHAWAVAIDPGKAGDVYVSWLDGGLYRSRDHGRNWHRIFDVDKQQYGFDWWNVGKITSIAVDTAAPLDNRVLYIATARRGSFKSRDDGVSWAPINEGLPAIDDDRMEPVTVIHIDPADPNRLYLGTQKGLFVSTDAGARWSRMAKGIFEKVENLSICRYHPQRVYATAHLPGENHYWGKAGIWRSDDGGENWCSITPDFMTYAGAVAVNPHDADYLYACTFLVDTTDPAQKTLIVRSEDGGATWEDIGRGIAFSRGRHITIDPGNPRRLFVSTRFGIIEIKDREAPHAPKGA